jgi:RNA polymerase sigma factor (sigma-70 family)
MTQTKRQTIASAIADYGKRLFGFIRNKVKTEEDAEDVLQDVWVQLSSLSDVGEIQSLGSWLYKVATNRVNDYYRKKKTVPIEDFSYENEEGELVFRELSLMENTDPNLAFFREMFWEELMLALNELPEKQKEVFVLNEMEDLTLQEIADRLGENLKTIISRKGYAIKYLRGRLAFLYNDLTQT